MPKNNFNRPEYRYLLATCLVLGMLLSGCGSMRIHDPGRMTVASETADIAKEFSASGGAVFDPMEANLETVNSLQDQLIERLILHETEAFLNVFSELTPDEIGARVTESVIARNELFVEFSRSEEAAVAGVNSALDRQQKISTLSGEISKPTGIKETIERLDNRLDWLEQGLNKFVKATNTMDAASSSLQLDGSLGDLLSLQGNAAEDAAVVQAFVTDAQAALDSVEEDEQVIAAKRLLAVAVQQASQSEQARLLEMRRHLGEIRRLKSRLKIRDEVAICKAYVAVVQNLYPALSDKDSFLIEYQKLRESGRYDCLFPLESSDPEVIEENQQVVSNWASGSTSGYVASTFAQATQAQADTGLSDEEKEIRVVYARSSAEFVGGLGILLFHEDQMIQDTLDQVYREQHLHSIRLSRISASQRGDLVHQLSEGLAVHYAGGIKPEEVAELLLFTAQVGALFFIGSGL